MTVTTRPQEEIDTILKAQEAIYLILRELPTPSLALDTLSVVSARLVGETHDQAQGTVKEAVQELMDAVLLQYAQLRAMKETIQ